MKSLVKLLSVALCMGAAGAQAGELWIEGALGVGNKPFIADNAAWCSAGSRSAYGLNAGSGDSPGLTGELYYLGQVSACEQLNHFGLAAVYRIPQGAWSWELKAGLGQTQVDELSWYGSNGLTVRRTEPSLALGVRGPIFPKLVWTAQVRTLPSSKTTTFMGGLRYFFGG